jgi:hypothetical protein
MEASRFELGLAQFAGAALASSMVFVAGVFIFVGAVMLSALSDAVLAGLLVATYAAQIYYLGQIKRRPAHSRVRIWRTSLLGHLVVFGVAAVLLEDPALAAVVLLPELISVACHVAALAHLRKGALAI